MRNRKGFTLVELLVVIAIIGVLIAILMPALIRARLAAQHAQCLSNLRQCGISLIMYANEWKRFPVPCHEAGTYGSSSAEPVTESLCDTRGFAANSVRYDLRDGLRNYVRDWRVFFCPPVVSPFDISAIPIPAPSGNMIMCSYVGFYGRALGVKDQFLLKPNGYWVDGNNNRRTVLLADKFYWSRNQRIVFFNHPERLNMTYLESDGTVPDAGGGRYFFAEYYFDYLTAPPVADGRIWGATLFTDGSASGATAGGLVVVPVPTLVSVATGSGTQGPPNYYWMIDR